MPLKENVVRSPPPDMNVVCDPPPNESVTHDLPPHENVVRSPPPDRNVVCSPPPHENVVCNPLEGQPGGKEFLQKIARLPAKQSQTRTSSQRLKTDRIMKPKFNYRRPGRSGVDFRNLRVDFSPKNRAKVGRSCSESLKNRAHRRQHRGRHRRHRARSRSGSCRPSSKGSRDNSGHRSSSVGSETAEARARENFLWRTIVFDRGKVTGLRVDE